MNNKENFKMFVRSNPVLIKYVKNDEMSWQKFYEIYDLYGEDDNAWKDYLKNEDAIASASSAVVAATGINGILNWIKNIDLDSVQEGVANLQRVVGVFGDISNKSDTKETNTYKPRPLYKHFDD